CGVKNFAMWLTGGKLTVALVTTHIALSEVPHVLKQSEIVRVGLLLADFLQSRAQKRTVVRNLTALSGQVSASIMSDDSGEAGPRIAVAGLNPHAGESGKIGREEIESIAPA